MRSPGCWSGNASAGGVETSSIRTLLIASGTCQELLRAWSLCLQPAGLSVIMAQYILQKQNGSSSILPRRRSRCSKGSATCREHTQRREFMSVRDYELGIIVSPEASEEQTKN